MMVLVSPISNFGSCDMVLSSQFKKNHNTDEVKSHDVFPTALFIVLRNMLLTSELVDEILKCDHSNESYWAVLSCGAVCYAVQDGFNF